VFTALKNKLKNAWCRWRYHLIFDYSFGTLPALVGSGKYVSVIRKGDYIEVSKNNNTIRIIPFLPMHGVAIEFINTADRTCCRTFVDYDQLRNIACGRNDLTEVEMQNLYLK
jgi:hypothetical protein